MIYLDHAATTPLCAEAREAMLPWLAEGFGNPSSLHHLGKAARWAVEQAREQTAALLGARPAEILFNSGATEGNNHVLKGVVWESGQAAPHLVSTLMEHEAVRQPLDWLTGQGCRVTLVAPGADGIVSPDAIQEALQPDTLLVSVMHANNEIGTLQPIAEIAALCRERGVLVHCDASQTVGHLPVQVLDLGVDLLTCSAHKFYAPKGVGVLYVRRGVHLQALVGGGSQQRGWRSGTENVAGIVGTGAAAVASLEALARGLEDGVAGLRDNLIERIQTTVSGAHLNGHRTRRVPGIANFSFEGIEGEGLILELDARGEICCSTGSACAAGSLEPSPVLLAIGLPDGLARSGTRFSLGRGTTTAEIDTLLHLLPRVLQELRDLNSQDPSQQGVTTGS